MKTIEQKIFDICHKLGEQTFNNIHLIESSHYNCSPPDYLKEYRIYHSGGHCIDISKSAIIDELGAFKGYEYTVSQTWDGFTEIPLNDLLQDLNYHKAFQTLVKDKLNELKIKEL